MNKDLVQFLLLNKTSTIRDALERLNDRSNVCRIVFVADDNRKIKGCITDGDIRRALLRGENLNSPAEKAARTDFISVKEGASKNAILNKMRKTGVRQVPVLDSTGRLLQVRTIDELTTADLTVQAPVVIMAGGKGQRLKPHTDDTPKPLLKVGNQTIIERLITTFQEKGVSEFYITVNYLADKIIDTLGDGERYGCKIHYVREPKSMGTAGSLSLLRDKLKTDFLVINGDILSTVDIVMLEHFHKEHQAMASVCTKVFTINIPYGVARVKNSNIVGIDEKPDQSFTVNAGIYFLSPKVLEIIKDDEYLDMTSLLAELIDRKHSVKCFQSMEPWIDIGTQREFEKAKKHVEYLIV